ncbi:XRE family transcriptional regulator [Streptomyces diacarni]|uniref:XRE family transcriptional regulator n=1 Tax=Streptomyces diacarni TaxID=2800381 RepID=A0A367F8V2_9ACTN|nr:XRE family transcriptional regulator [Streptomyces diacarni]
MSIPPSLGEDVRRVRRARGISQTAFATATGYTQSYVSRVESGEFMPSVKFAEACDRTFGTGDLFVRQLRRVVEGEYPAWFAPYIDAERRAATIRDFSTIFITGLLQTEAYARVSLVGGRPNVSPGDVDAKVASRLRRREILMKPDPPRVWVVLYEACLRARVGSARVMADQMKHLMEQARLHAALTVQVLPYSAAEVGIGVPYVLLEMSSGKPCVFVEGPQGGRPYEGPETVANSAHIYDEIRASSLSPGESLALISAVRDEHERNAVDQKQLQRQTRGQLRRVGPGARARRGGRPGAGQ